MEERIGGIVFVEEARRVFPTPSPAAETLDHLLRGRLAADDVSSLGPNPQENQVFPHDPRI